MQRSGSGCAPEGQYCHREGATRGHIVCVLTTDEMLFIDFTVPQALPGVHVRMSSGVTDHGRGGRLMSFQKNRRLSGKLTASCGKSVRNTCVPVKRVGKPAQLRCRSPVRQSRSDLDSEPQKSEPPAEARGTFFKVHLFLLLCRLGVHRT